MKKLSITIGLILALFSLNAAWTPAIKIRCGALDFNLSNYQSWNFGEINFQGVNVCRKISYFGNVAMFDLNGKVGWVGSGHKDNDKKGETELKAQFFADGKEFQPDKTLRSVKEFEMRKSSVLHDLKIEYTLKVKDNEIYEHAKITVLRDTDVKLLYIFMHPWCPVFTSAKFDYGKGRIEETKFDNKRFLARKRGTPLVTYFAPEVGITTTTQVKTIKPFNDGKDDMFHLWNRGNAHDRKLYYQAIRKRIMKAGASGEYEMTTRFFYQKPAK